jgi:acetolactate synthase-1/2/3 large subunit
MAHVRGADIVARTLASAGVTHLFSLSGNHIMPIYDAALDAHLEIVHTRHEGAAVHMADAWGRLTGTPGVALLTGGPGHANGIGALYTALESESPLVLLSGHAPLAEVGRGSFQEMRQADMAVPVVKASWTAQRADGLGADIARALRLAREGRPGPVHVSLPFDLLESKCETAVPHASLFRPRETSLSDEAADAVLAALARAERPIVLTGPVMADGRSNARERLTRALNVPVLAMESPRGLNDPAFGAFAEAVSRADLIVLLGKKPDFTLRFAAAPAIAGDCRFVVIDPDATAVGRAIEAVGPERIALSAIADSIAAAERLVEHAAGFARGTAWNDEVEAAACYRPSEWASVRSSGNEPVHPVEVGRAVQEAIDASAAAVFVSDGGEFGQWAQACIAAPTRIINGQAGSIGSAIPFALASKLARPDATVIATTGDGACGFHLLEIDTAVRNALAPVIVVGNDACWNAEHQIQLRAYGRERAHGCELAPSRYDEVAIALGGHGELVTSASELPAALTCAIESRKPAVVNVLVQRLPAPSITRRSNQANLRS